jgi:hypothetical protein
MDAGFALVDEYCKKKKIGIVGYYHANAAQGSNDWTTLSKRVADKVRASTLYFSVMCGV